eukprot:GHRQ01035275.1.p1 GENE.GHRQ01035275.1~~GHRQ01035275.1.p1  ORF type:complete len:167 (+),score=42.34 GHRQ01035275.1:114-614(+)
MHTRSCVSCLCCLPGYAPSVLAEAPACLEREELSFTMIKPDGVHRGLISEVIARFERKGYKLVGIKVLVPSQALAARHYAEHDGKPFFPKLVNFLSSGPVVAMVWEGKQAVKFGRTMIGATNPLASAPGTIRCVHASVMQAGCACVADAAASVPVRLSGYRRAWSC